jgi:hypothetical protein
VQDQDLLLSRRIKWGATEGIAYAMVVQQKNIVSLASSGRDSAWRFQVLGLNL